MSAVEVIEHVPDDAAFIREMARVLKPGGVALLTTPNGIAMPNVNPDELRHYSTQEFRKLMATYFDDVDVGVIVKRSRFNDWSNQPWSIKHPIRLIKTLLGGFLNSRESIASPMEAEGLYAIGYKKA